MARKENRNFSRTNIAKMFHYLELSLKSDLRGREDLSQRMFEILSESDGDNQLNELITQIDYIIGLSMGLF